MKRERTIDMEGDGEKQTEQEGEEK